MRTIALVPDPDTLHQSDFQLRHNCSHSSFVPENHLGRNNELCLRVIFTDKITGRSIQPLDRNFEPGMRGWRSLCQRGSNDGTGDRDAHPSKGLDPIEDALIQIPFTSSFETINKNTLSLPEFIVRMTSS